MLTVDPQGKVVAIVQARMRSTRLPGKVLADIVGYPMLWHVVQRVDQATHVDQVVIATTDDTADDSIVTFCELHGLACFRGSEADVLARYYHAATKYQATVIVRVTADCPLQDPAVIDRVVAVYLEGGYDYVSNTLKYTYPDGLDTEVFSYEALAQAYKCATKNAEREHVTPYIKHPKRFRLHNVESDIAIPGNSIRWTVDEPADLAFVRAIYAQLTSAHGPSQFSVQDVLHLLAERPEIASLEGKSMINEGYYISLYEQAVAGAAPKRKLEQSNYWFARSQESIPGAAQTFSKAYNQYVQGVSPVFLERGKGCRVWDVDGNEYIDYVQGLLPNILGYAHEEVNAAAKSQLDFGHSFSLPHPLEVELAERLKQIIPCAEMVRFGKNGSDATAGAVRAARAFTGRDRIACCGYHGWQDWYIGSTSRNAGIPASVCELTHPFPYNDIAALDELLGRHPGEFAAVIMEAFNFYEPGPGYLQKVKEVAHRHGALLIFDEICTGFHFGLGGAQTKFGVVPDLACFGKAMGNGFPISCVVGRADIMRIFSDIFFSFTFGGEVASMAAALKVLDILEHTDALSQMAANGERLKDGFNAMVRQAGLEHRLECVGYPSWTLLKFRDAEGKDSLLERSLFQQEAVKRGLLILATHNITATHDTVAIEQTLERYAEIIKTFADWLQEADPEQFLEGPVAVPVFRVRS